MSEETKTGLVMFFIGVLAGICLVGLLFMFNPYDNHFYKQGQVDAINGIIKYELVVRPDSTRVWELIQKEK